MVLSLTERVRIGCSGLPPGMRRHVYHKKLSFIEACESPTSLPKATVLRRWRREAPETTSFSLVISDNDLLVPSIVMAEQAEVERISKAAEILRADAVVFRTSPRITPSSQYRDRLKRFFNEVAQAQCFPMSIRAWEPQGLWEPESAARLCAELDLVYACDPLSGDPLAPGFEFFATLPPNLAYFRITGIGRQHTLEEPQLDQLLALTTTYDRIWMAFGGRNSLKNALALQQRCNAIC